MRIGITILAFLSVFGNLLSGQGSANFLGVPRMQYRQVQWNTLSSENFEVYYTNDAEVQARKIIRFAELNLESVEDVFDFRLAGQLRFVFYNNLYDYNQSNINFNSSEQNVGGTTDLSKNIVPLVYQNDFQDLYYQIRKGIAHVLIQDLIFGSGMQEKIQNHALLSLPVWYSQGLEEWVSGRWDIDMDNRMRDLVVAKKKLNFNAMVASNPVFTGHSFWKFITERYGEQTLSNILYITKISRNIDNGFFFVMGKEMPELVSEWQEYYKKVYGTDDNGRDDLSTEITLGSKIGSTSIGDIKVSADGKFLALVSQNMRSNKVWILDLKSGKRKEVFSSFYNVKGNAAGRDELKLAWKKNSKADEQLVVIQPTFSGLKLIAFSPKTGLNDNKFLIPGLSSIQGAICGKDGKQLILIANKNSQPDIFHYDFKTARLVQLTSDADFETSVALADSGVYYYTSKESETGSFSYLKKLEAGIAIVLLQSKVELYTNVEWMDGNLTLLSTASGIRNLYQYDFGSNALLPLSNNQRSSQLVHLNLDSEKAYWLIHAKGSNRIYETLIPDTATTANPEPVYYRLHTQGIPEPEDNAKEDTNDKKIRKDTLDQKPKYYFVSGFSEEQDADERRRIDSLSRLARNSRFEVSRSGNYRTTFMPEKVVTLQLDNTNFSGMLDYFPLYNRWNQSLNTPVYIHNKFALSDLMRNQTLSAGFRTSIGLGSGDFYFVYDNRKSKLDYRLQLYSFTQRLYERLEPYRLNVYSIEASFSYPLNKYLGVKMRNFVRQDELNLLGTRKERLEQLPYRRFASGNKLELIFDNTVKLPNNPNEGIIGRAYIDFIQPIQSDKKPIVLSGWDARFYKTITRNIIWANRLSGAISMSDEKVIYFMGGMENWLIPRFDNDNQISQNESYHYRVQTGSMRGFVQNARNGSNYALLNSELRIPVFQVLSSRPLRSEFWNGLMLVPFVDAGTAWTGSSVFSRDNNYSVRVFDANPSGLPKYTTVIVKNLRNPLIAAFGFGLRTRVFGYHLKGDLGWGIEDGQIKAPALQFSLGFDF